MTLRLPSMFSLLLLLCFFWGGTAEAQIPSTLNYQGFLTSPSGAPVNSAGLQMVFNIYNVQTLGSPLHTETQTVTVSNGIFNVVIGSSATLTLPFDAPYYLGVTPGPDPEMSPRQPLAASPYAIRAATAANADALATGGSVGQVLAGTGAAPAWTGSPAFTGDVTVSGSLGIPTASTSAILPTKLNVVANSPKATVATTRALAVTSNDASAPFALDIKVVGAAALVDRGVSLQTTDWNTADGGNLLLQPQGGKVGVGTTNPTKALVEINGFANNTLFGTVGLFSPSGAGSQIPQQVLPYSLYASLLVAANSYVAFSDSRIKRLTGRSDTAKDLTTLAAIEITDYTYIDSVNQGNRPHKKVIAQQVEKIYPQAVNQTTDVVPDIYLKADVKDGWVKLATNLKKGERVRLIGKAANGVFEVLEVAANRFRTDFKADADTVFVYGREVKDFRSVDYEAIAMLNVSATQELNRRVAQQAAEIAQLKTQLAMLAQQQAQVAEIAKANTAQIAYRPMLN